MRASPPSTRLGRFMLASLLVYGFCTAGLFAAKPNLVIFYADDLGWGELGCQGNKEIPTPHIDSIAKNGVRFTNGYVSGPYCSPTRAGLMTGRYQQRFGHEFNPGPAEQAVANFGLPLQEVTFPQRMKSAGYATGMFGKWHLGYRPEFHPLKRGFDEFFGFLGGAHSYFDKAGFLRGTKPVDEMDYATDAFGREAISFIERHKSGAPWFLYLAFNAVHTPMHATDDRLKKFAHIADEQRRIYAAMMFAMDEAIGRVRKAVAASGQEQNTIVYFISDNGGPNMPGVTVNGSINLPLRGSKRTTLEGGIRVPFVVSWPGKIKPGVFEPPAIQLDLNVTTLAAAGVDVKPEWKLDGVNLLPYLTGTKSGAPHDVLYWRFGDQMAIRIGDYKLVRYDMNVETRTGGKQAASDVKLYNLASDIGEKKNLFATMPDKAKELQSKWDAWNATLMKPGSGDTGEGGEGKGRKKKKAQ
jgi:arylsulfatase A-like enzyme